MIFLLLVCIIGIFLIGSASANDLNGTSLSQIDGETVSVEEIDQVQEEMGSVDSIGNEGLCESESGEVLTTNHTPRDSSEIQTSIDNADVGDTIIFDGNYIISNTINVAKQLTFVGINDATIDGNKNVRLFDVSNGNVTFKNILFKNGHSSDYNGGAITGNCRILNCTFERNSAGTYGGAIRGDCSVVNCTFERNSAGYYGGAIRGDCSVVNCNFNGNAAGYGGGAIYGGGTAVNCTFIYNDGHYYGGAIGYGSAVNCTFIYNNAGDGGAIFSYGSAVDCTFINNSATNIYGGGGAIEYCSATNCIFIGNWASGDGGAIYFDKLYDSGSVTKCTFINNTANNGGALCEGVALNCSFEGNKAGGDGGATYKSYVANSIFKHNSATNGGALSYGKSSGCTFIGNHADRYGGAACNANVSLNSFFEDNSALEGNDNYNVTFFLDGNSFSDLNVFINGNNDSDIYLDRNYTFNLVSDSNFKEGILVSHDVTIHGNGYTIDGDSVARIFRANNSNVVFENISFVNGKTLKSGGAIMGEFTAVNCTFKYNDAGQYGGAFYGNGNLLNCTFIKNTALYGGAIRGQSSVFLMNCNFENNSAYSGSAIYVYEGYCSLHNCSFVNNSAQYGTIYGTNVFLKNCNFVGNSLYYDDDVDIVPNDGEYEILDCIFDKPPKNINYYYTPCLNVNDLIVYNDNNAFLIVNLSDVRGPLFSKTITFNLKDIEYNVTTDSEGLAYLNIKNYLSELGRYNVAVSFAGDSINYPVSKNVTVTITNYNTFLEVNDLSVGLGEGVLIASLSDMKGQLYGKTLTFNVNGIDYNVTTDSDGLARFNIGDYLNEKGSYEVNVSFAGDELNNPISVISHVVIGRYNSVLEVFNLSALQGEDGFLIAKLSDSHGPLVNKTVEFIINEIGYYNITDSEGIARFNVKDYLTSLGKYDVSISFSGDEYTNPTSAVANVLINLLKANLTVVREGKFYKDNRLIFRLFDSKTNGSISDAIINLAFSNGVNVDIITDYRGIASYEIPFSPGSYNLTSRVVMDYSDINIVELNNFFVSKFIGQIEVSQADDCRLLNIRLFNPETGDIFRKFHITLSFNTGDVVEVLTDNSGMASYNMPFGAGIYSLLASVNDEFAEFDNISLSNIIINDMINSEVYFNREILEFNYLDSGIIVASLKGCTLSADEVYVVNQPNAVILIGEYNFITVSNLTAGNYVLRVKTTPDASHNSVTRAVNIKVNKIDSILNLSNNASCEYGDFASISLDFGGCSILKENIEVVGHPEAVIGIEDNILSVSNLSVGEYTLSVTTSPDENHKAITRNMTIFVYKAKSDIKFDDFINFDCGSYGSTNVNTVGCTFKKDDIRVVGHSEAIIRVSSNAISISNLAAGNYNLSVTTTPDENHDSVTRSVAVTVNKLSSILNFNRAISFRYGSYGFTTIDFSDCSILKDNIHVVDHPEALIDYDDDKIIVVSGLDVGDYILSVTTTPDENYDSVTRMLSVSVNKIDSKVTFTKDVSFDYLESGSTSIVVDGGNVTNISIVGHPEANVTLIDNEIIVSNLTAGDYVLCVVTVPDENHNSVTVNKSFTVNRIDSSIAFNNTEITFDQGGFGTVNVTVIGGSVDENLTIVEDHPEAVINVTGNVISVSNLTAGTYILRVSSNPDENHKSNIRSIYVIVSKMPSTVNFTEEIVFDYNGVGYTTVNVLGGSVSPSDIVVIGHDEADININNKNLITVSNLTAGNYVLQVTTTPDADHRSIVGTIGIIVNRIQSSISCDDIILDYDKIGLTTIYVDGGVLNDSDVKIDGYPDAVRVSGNSITISGLNVGNYTLHVSSIPDNNHYSTEATLKVRVNPVKSSITLSGNISFDYLGSNSIFAFVSGGVVEYDNITIDGNPKEAKITFDNNIIGVSGLNAGTYTLRVKSTPDKNHLSDEQTALITVNRIASSISFGSKSIVFDYLKSGSVTVAVIGGNVLDSGLSVVGHPEVKPTIKDNKITVSDLKVGKYTLRVENTPNGNYKSDVQYIDIIVNKVSAAIKVKAISLYHKEKKKWIIKLIDTKNNNGIANMVVKLKVYTGKKSKVYSAKTNSKGVATFKKLNKLSVGKHKVILSFSKYGYACKSVKSSVKVKKVTYLKFVNPEWPKLNDMGIVSFSVKDKATKKYLNKVAFKVYIYDGKKVSTDELVTGNYKSGNGKLHKAYVSLGTNILSVGKHKIVFKPISGKYKGTFKTSITIKKGMDKEGKKYYTVSGGKLSRSKSIK